MQGATPLRVGLGSFEVDLKAGELRDGEKKIRLQEQPFQILLMLVDAAGEVVSREEIRKTLWPNDTVVEFDHSIHTAIGKLRQALGDARESPKYIETVARRGYRLLVAVTCLEPDPGVQPKTEVAGAQSGAAATRQTEAGGLIGRKISHYRVLEIIGGGGMGLVYKAEDLKLGRRVALKFLPEELARHSISLQRFEREARTASTLNHRNICTIYEVEEHDGQPCIVMELLEGETLRDRLAAWQSKPMAVDEVLQVAIQICDGLDAAHQRGIIHRDIKPPNIFLTTGGQAKILDFGVAKFVAGDGEAVNPGAPENDIDVERACAASASAGQPASVDNTLTRTGASMGTAGYMSPEQVRGEKLDARTDIFSFGLVLYEMATGQRAFSGETSAVVHDSILHNAPVPVRELNSRLPAGLLTAIDKCLEKDPAQRYQSAAEVRAALEQVQRLVAPTPAGLRRLKKVVIASLTVLLIAFCVAGIWWWRRPLAQSAFKHYRMTRLTSTGNVAFVDMSADGKYVAYRDGDAGKESLWVQQVATSQSVRVLGPVSGLEAVRFTPDGNYLYYEQGYLNEWTSSLYRIAVLGGAPEKIATDLSNLRDYPNSIDFSPDGKEVVFARHKDTENDLVTAHADGGGERRILTLQASETIGFVAWAPDGQTIAFAIDEANIGAPNCIAFISSKGGKERRILRSIFLISGIAWLPDQSGLIVTGWSAAAENSLWVVSYPDGSVRRITTDIAEYFGVNLSRGSARLVSVQQQIDSWLWIAPALNPSQATQLRDGASNEDGHSGIHWLPDGRLVYARGRGQSELWLTDHDGSGRQQLTHTNASAYDPSATVAGTTIVFTYCTLECDKPNIWRIDSDGSNLKQITNDSIPKRAPEISPDEKWITYYSMQGPWTMSLSSGERTNLDPRGGTPSISPDGRWIAFGIWDEKEKEAKIEIVASDRKSPRRFLSLISELQTQDVAQLQVQWTATGDAITFVHTQNGVSNLWSKPIDGGPAKQLTNFTSLRIWSHAWSGDGKYLVMGRGNYSRDAVMLTDLH